VIRGSVERQHRVGVELGASGGERLLVLGGAGNMGSWFDSFSGLLGHRVHIVDPSLGHLPMAEGRFSSLLEIEHLDMYDAILVSVPLGRTAEAIDELVARQPRGLVIEIASIKDHLKDSLERATEAGVRTSSLHPMFGPGKSPYEPLTFVLACREDPRTEQARISGWLQHPYTHIVPVPFDHHDRLMGWLLGLAHLSGMLFGCALTQSGLSAAELRHCASTTYNRQSETALSVLSEDPDLYYDIQELNPHRLEVYQSARDALSGLIDAIQTSDREAFRTLMTQARQFLTSYPR
ncbi:MAG: prephenate dehydrogenase, partial [Acidobacteriota bacterium]